MNYYSFTSLFNGVVVLWVGFYLLSRQWRSSLYQSFAAFSVSVGLWCIFYAIWQNQNHQTAAFFYIRVLMCFCYFVPFSFLWFVLKLTGRPCKSWQGALLLAVPLFFTVFGFSPLMIRAVVPVLNFRFWPQPGILMHVYAFSFFIIVLISYWVLWKGYIATHNMTLRWQIKWIALAVLPGWIGGATNWCLWYGIPVSPVAHFFVGISFLIIFYAVIRARLFDVDAITDLVQEAKLTTLGVIASSINHEVRNPLYVIKGLAETLRERAEEYLLDPGQFLQRIKETADKTIAQSDRALGIIRDFSMYAKRETDKVYEKQPVKLKELVERILPFVESELGLKHVTVIQDIFEGAVVVADRQSLEEVFVNLVINACQAMLQGGEIKITAQTDLEKVVITIQDTGPGIPEERAKDVFRPFFTTKATGTGLGLYVVKQLVERNAGRIKVESQLGIGTSFIIILPAYESV